MFVVSTIQPASVEEIKYLILSSSKFTSSSDPEPSNLLPLRIDVIAPVITRIVNLCLSSTMIPKEFKYAVVKPLFEKPTLDSSDLKNYCPISKISFLSKLVKSIIANRLLTHLSSHGLLAKVQSAYRKFHSSETALLYVQNDILVALEAGHSTALLLLDIFAVFDTIDRNILIHRLQH